MPDDSAPTPRPDPEQANTPDSAATPPKPASKPRRKPSSTGAPRKPRPRQPAKPKTPPDTTSAESDTTSAETVLEVATSEPAETVPDAPADVVEIAEVIEAAAAAQPEVIDTPPIAQLAVGDTAEVPAPDALEPSAIPPAAVAVDPAPHHAPPAATLAPRSAPLVTASAAGPVTLAQALESDGVRRVIVTVSYVFCLIGALAAFGVVDSGSRRLSGVLSPTLSLLSAATQADRLWWVVLVGLAVYVGWMWLPGNATDLRARAMGYSSAVAMAIFGVWFFLIRTGELVSGAVVSLLVVGALMVTLRRAERFPSRGFVGRQCAQLGFAAALGWMSVLSTGAIAGALVTHEVPAYFVSAETWGILGATALLGVGMALVRYFPGRLYIAAALSWGFVCIAYARVMGQPRSYFVAVVALVSALLILIAGAAVFLWVRGRARERVS